MISSLYSKELFPIRLTFTKQFIKNGVLPKGHTLNDEMPFISVDSAERWLSGVAKNCKEFKIIKFEILTRS